MHRFFILFLLFLTPTLSQSQEDLELGGTAQEGDYDPNYIDLMEDTLVLRLFSIQKINTLSIMEKVGNSQLDLKPNENTNLGFGFNYRWLGLNLAFNFPFINNDDDVYGNSKSFNFLVYAYPRKFGITFFFQQIQGYYVENMTEFNAQWDPTIFYQRPDIKTGALGGSFFYIFNEKRFSYRSVFVQNEIQKRSAGSFFLGGNLAFIGLSGDSSIVPHSVQSRFDSSTHIVDGNYGEIGFQGGYSANIIFLKHMFLNFTLKPGLSFQGGTIKTEDPFYDNKDRQFVTPTFGATFGLGYNKDRWYLALSSGFSTLSLGKSLNYQYGRVLFVFAYRLRAPKVVKKAIPEKLFGHDP